MAQSAVIDATDQSFEQDVLAESRRRPVVVDFWAPWCGPCQMLGPTLERVAAEYGEGVRLVKVNTDENPALAQAFQIQSIPAVKAFKDGAIVAEFLGAQAEPQVRQFFAGIMPSQADVLAQRGADAFRVHDLAEARRHFEAALALDPAHSHSIGGMAGVLIEEGDLDAAEAMTQRAPHAPQVKRQIARLRFERGGRGADEAALLARIEADEDDVDAHYRLGCFLVLDGFWGDALEHFLKVVATDRKYGDDAGRLAALDAFEVLGPDHPVTQEFRPRLGMLLF